MNKIKITHSHFIAAALFLILFIIVARMKIGKYIAELPKIEKIEGYIPNLVTRIYDANNETINELYVEKRSIVPLEKIPKNLKNSVISVEDRNFYSHWGIDLFGIFRAAVKNVIAFRLKEGGSTITQQLTKVILLTQEKTLERKIKELLLAINLEVDYSKDEILEMYLNQIYLGHGAYGMDQAGKLYFGKHIEDLNLAECALLAGLIRSPGKYSPFLNIENANERRRWALLKLLENNFIEKKEFDEAMEFPINTQRFQTLSTKAPYFTEYVRQALEPVYGNDTIYKGGLNIYTSIDLFLQKTAEETLDTHLSAFDEEQKKLLNNPTDYINVQGAICALDPKTGEIKAFVGGRDFKTSQFNRLTQAKRQPGSSFKPIIYTAALDKGYTPTTIIDDSPVSYYNIGKDWELLSKTTDFSDVPADIMMKISALENEHSEDPEKKKIQLIWTPQNYTKKFFGEIIMRKAVEHSINICAVKILENIGPNTAIDYARKMGVTSGIYPYLSMALGTFVITPLELASCYATLANGGIYTKPYYIKKVEDNNSNLLEESFPLEKEALSTQTAFLMTHLLKGVIENGTGGQARALGKPAAGKTGTTNDYTDAWFVGYTPDLVCLVWVGYDDAHSLGKKMTGGRVACPIWTDFMKNALKGKPSKNFSVPKGIVFAKVDPATGLLATTNTKNAYLEAFIDGTEPKEYSVFSKFRLAVPETRDLDPDEITQ